MRFVGRVFRAHNPRWAFEPLSGAGAASFGGRFNRKGREALYTSLRPETAWIEAQQAFPVKAQPLTICAYEVDCSDLVDLADQLERQKLSVAPEDVACPWEDLASLGKAVPSWAIAERLIAAGNAGALVPSFAPGARAQDINLVLWHWSETRPHRVAVIDDYGRLPRDSASWA